MINILKKSLIFILILCLPVNLSCKNRAEELVLKGNGLADEKKYDEAIKAYDEAIKIVPDHKTAWNNKGLILADQGKYEESLKCFDKAISIDSKFVQALYNKGTVLCDQGKFDKGREYFEKVLKIAPDHKEARQLLGE